jgi:oxygen-independent coproporphyrinogen III oxidase
LAGIYIHIPFCKQACNYCNFHFSVSLKNKDAIIKAIVTEIEISNDFIDDKNIETIYFGGGTPSLLHVSEIALLFSAIRKRFIVASEAEITLEANPDDITLTTLQNWMSFGVNRLSVGLQSFNEAELKWMNRAHNAAQSLHCLGDIEKAGIKNYSVDLIYGSPLQSNDDLRKNFELIASRNIPHISCYALTVENGTILNKLIKENKSQNIDTEKQTEQFFILLEMMEANGYEQYEISNFSKPNFRSKHNSSYWKGKPYFGFGPSAHSFNGYNKRRWNIANNSLYLQSLKNNAIPYEEEILTDAERLNEYVMTAIRTIEGINLKKVTTNFGLENNLRILKLADKYLHSKKIKQTDSFLQLTKEGKFFADGIASDLFL